MNQTQVVISIVANSDIEKARKIEYLQELSFLSADDLLVLVEMKKKILDSGRNVVKAFAFMKKNINNIISFLPK